MGQRGIKLFVKRILDADQGSDDKEWCDVLFEINGQIHSWRPKLSELGRILQVIYEIEDRKYSPPAKGGEMTRDFVNKAMDGIPISSLEIEYEIPNKDRVDKLREFNVDDYGSSV